MSLTCSANSRAVRRHRRQFQRQRDRIVRALPPAGRPHRPPVRRAWRARDDLVQVARVGLVNAVIRFDVNAGSDFVSFAVPTIMGEVRRHFRDNSWSVKVPRRLKELHLRLGAATAELSQRLGRAPTASELAEELEMDRDEVDRGPRRWQLLQHAVDRQRRRQRQRGGARDRRHDRRRRSRTRSDRESRSVAAVARCVAGAGAAGAAAAVLRIADADTDRRAGRHLADARVPVVGEISSATPGPTAVADAVRPARRPTRRRQCRRSAGPNQDRRSAAAA